ncbi:ABC transporter ATP-binding protein [Polymorphospora sp. NPDC050346]|uniref:ABC transporter ATP-binding protein n=1 Tax=Polymorphospora sp. NPDC050346 TaxID=3155780 RepID=UPI0033D3CF33
MTAIEVRNLHKRYGDRLAVRDVSFAVEEGEIFGIVGPNGAGKTTTVECVTGLRRPDGGSVSVLGLDPVRDHQRVSELVGAQLQESALPDRLRVGEALELFASFYAAPADPDRLIDELGLADKRRAPYAKLSGGQKQRLSIALALVGNPRIAVLDELTTGLDPQARQDTWRLVEQVRDRGVTVLLVTHFMAEAAHLCDRVAVIRDGAVVALDTPHGLTGGVESGQRLGFRPDRDFDERLLAGLPGVTSVRRQDGEVLVTGTGDLVSVVLVELTRHGVVPTGVQLSQPSLDDAYLALIGGSAGPEETA